MAWEHTTEDNLYSGLQAHKLSATHLLASPDDNRNPLNDSTGIFTVGYASNVDRISPLFTRTRYNLPRYGRSLFGCFFACHRNIKQFIVKRKIEHGLRLYQKNKQHSAIRIWKSALRASSKREDSFALLSYLYQAHMDCGKFREALEYGHMQLGISEELDSSNMRAEAYLNLARAHERLGCLERALSYARHSLYNECDTQCRTGGMVHLTVASVYLEMGGFCRALEDMQTAHKIAMQIGDPALELQVYVLLSELFERLQDSEKAARYAAKAYDLSRSLQLGDLNSRYHRAVLLRMASAFRKQGEFGDAHDYCSEASRLALLSGDHGTLTRSIRILGDIYRKKLDIDVSCWDEYSRSEEKMRLYNLQKAFRQYEQAMGSAANLGDRMAQMEAMDGVARCLDILRLQGKICNCRPLEFNTRLLEVASSIGARMLVLKTRQRLASIYQSLGDEEASKNQTELANQTELSLGLSCGSCGDEYGLEADSLEALPCAHILHARCAHEILRRRDKSKPRLQCPSCNRLVNSRLNLNNCDGAKAINGKLPPMPTSSSVTPPHPFFQSNLFLQSLSLRASTLTINDSEPGQLTSSV